jgi:hypothetical protein
MVLLYSCYSRVDTSRWQMSDVSVAPCPQGSQRVALRCPLFDPDPLVRFPQAAKNIPSGVVPDNLKPLMEQVRILRAEARAARHADS